VHAPEPTVIVTRPVEREEQAGTLHWG